MKKDLERNVESLQDTLNDVQFDVDNLFNRVIDKLHEIDDIIRYLDNFEELEEVKDIKDAARDKIDRLISDLY